MPVIQLDTLINAPLERCFDLARSVEAHTESTAKTKERAVGGVTAGLMGLDDTVTWEAVHFGIRQRLTSKITRYERPYLFVDEMVQGAFHSFKHLHEFKPVDNKTLMRDTFNYKSPLGAIGALADFLFLERYMQNLLQQRAQYLKLTAETHSLNDIG